MPTTYFESPDAKITDEDIVIGDKYFDPADVKRVRLEHVQGSRARAILYLTLAALGALVVYGSWDESNPNGIVCPLFVLIGFGTSGLAAWGKVESGWAVLVTTREGEQRALLVKAKETADKLVAAVKQATAG